MIHQIEKSLVLLNFCLEILDVNLVLNLILYELDIIASLFDLILLNHLVGHCNDGDEWQVSANRSELQRHCQF